MRPILMELFGMKIYSYGFMMVTGYFFALWFILKFAEKAGMKSQDALDMSLISFVSGILGSRIVFVLLNLNDFSTFASLWEFQKGGLAWHGGIAGGVIAMTVYSKVKKYSPLSSFDLILTPSMAGLAIGRIGCFFNGCCYGKPAQLPWAVVFPSHRNPIPVHPAQLYEMVLDFVVFFFLWYWWDKRKFAGENSLLMLSLYSVARFIVEFFRYNTPDQMISGLSLAQWISLAFFAAGIIAVLLLRKNIPITLKDALPAADQENSDDESISNIDDENISNADCVKT